MMELGGNSVPGPRPYNEDTFLLKDLRDLSFRLSGLRAFVLVSDGMGGHQSGDVASRIARETAEAYIDDCRRLASEGSLSIEPALALQEIVSEAHAGILRAAEEAGGASMGATFVGAFVGTDRAWIGHVGDSRAYLIHKGEGRQITVDHSQVGRLIADGVLTEEQAQHHPSRNVIERALGFSGAEAEVDIVDLHVGDALVLCSDGLSTVLSGADIAAICAASPSAQEACANLTKEALAAETDDNTTAVVWAEDWGAFRMSSPHELGRRKQVSAVRRAAARHRNAHSASLWFAGVAAVAVLMLVAAAMSHTGATAGGGVTSGATSPTVPVQTRTSNSQPPDVGGNEATNPGKPTNPANKPPFDTKQQVLTAKSGKGGPYFLRATPDQTSEPLAIFPPGMQHIRSVGTTDTADGVYAVFDAGTVKLGWLQDVHTKAPLARQTWDRNAEWLYSRRDNFLPKD
jgi:serine/threonine protein phosphatase PrpC